MHASIDADEAKELMALAGVLGQLGVRGSLCILNPFEYHCGSHLEIQVNSFGVVS